jgi:hypothetical protein
VHSKRGAQDQICGAVAGFIIVSCFSEVNNKEVLFPSHHKRFSLFIAYTLIKISNPLICRSNACGVLCLSFVNAGQPWEESYNQRATKHEEGTISNTGNKVCSLDLLNCVFS